MSALAIGRQRQDRLYAVMLEFATRGEKLPSNRKLREMIGIPPRGEGALHRAIYGLTDQGRILMHYGDSVQYRRVEICATGAMTEWACTCEPRGRKAKQPMPAAPKIVRVAKVRQTQAALRTEQRKPPEPKAVIPRIVKTYPLLASRGMSDFAIYGHLADAVRACRRAGDVVHRDERRPTIILINGRPGDVKARAAWHGRISGSQPRTYRDPANLSASCTG